MDDVKLIIDQQEYSFGYSPSANAWQGKVLIQDRLLDVEIYLDQVSGFSWDDFVEFVIFMQNLSSLSELIENSHKLLNNFIDVVRFGIGEDVGMYFFKLDCMWYKGKVNSFIFSGYPFSYDLLFKLHRKDMVETDDPYGLYLVTVENALIKGIRREQI